MNKVMSDIVLGRKWEETAEDQSKIITASDNHYTSSVEKECEIISSMNENSNCFNNQKEFQSSLVDEFL